MNTADPTTVATARALERLVDRTCWLDGHHVVLHDTTGAVWVAYIAASGDFLALAAWTGPTHDSRDPAWMTDPVTPVRAVPSWRFPMHVLHAPPPLEGPLAHLATHTPGRTEA